MSASENAAKLSELPPVSDLLTREPFTSITATEGHTISLRIARTALDEVRNCLSSQKIASDREELSTLAVQIAKRLYQAERSARISRVINATGVVIHTNLGRSVLSENAAAAIAESIGYCTLEYDLTTASRGKRGAGAESMLCELTGAEAAVIVNNCAAAAFLVLRVLANGKDVVISRGELVEIGGDFRVPDVLAESGANLREVGTTNRTKLADYRRAISDKAGLLMRVHPSNYRVIGFTESPSNSEIAGLSKEYSVPFFEDAGSGALVDLSMYGLDEPSVSQSIKDGVDIVAFSGDKLMGGVQAGFIVGRRNLIEAVRTHPLYRAFRVDKLAYAAIEATLSSFAREKHFNEIPTLRMIALEPEVIRERAEKLIHGLNKSIQAKIIEGESVIGGGAAPDVKPPTWLISLSVAGKSPEGVDAYFRGRTLPIIGRIAEGSYLLDLRTVQESESSDLRKAIEDLGDHEF